MGDRKDISRVSRTNGNIEIVDTITVEPSS